MSQVPVIIGQSASIRGKGSPVPRGLATIGENLDNWLFDYPFMKYICIFPAISFIVYAWHLRSNCLYGKQHTFNEYHQRNLQGIY